MRPSRVLSALVCAWLCVDSAAAGVPAEPPDDPSAPVRRERRWIDVAPAAVPAGLPLLAARRAGATPAVDRGALRSLLVNRRFDRLTAVLEQFQAAFEKDPGREVWMSGAFEALGVPHARELALLEEWIAAKPRSFAPYLARAAYWVNTGFLWRGERWSRETSRFEFDRMAEAFARARADLRQALSLSPGLVQARTLSIVAAIAEGDRASAGRALREALALCPTCYQPRAVWLWALRPEWGGSLDEMEEFAGRADRRNPRNRTLGARVLIARAREARAAGDAAQAAALLDDACALGGDAAPFIERLDRVGAPDLDAYLEDLARAEAIEPGLPGVLARRAVALAGGERWEEAGRDLRAALRADPTLERAVALHPQVVRALDALAHKARVAGDDATAARLYALAVDLAPADRDLRARADAVAPALRGEAPRAAGPATGDARPDLRIAVVDAEGRPVPRAWIVLERGPGRWERLRALAASATPLRADEAGRLVTPAAIGPWVVMALRPDRPGTGVAAPLSVTTTGAEVRLVIGGARRIEGRVSASGNQPVAGVEVQAVPDGDLASEPRALASAVSGPDGAFALEGVDGGRYLLFARGRGPRGRLASPAAGSPVVGGARSVQMQVRPVHVLRGRVLVSGEGPPAPPEAFTVTARPFGQRELSSRDGVFSVESLNPYVNVRVAFSVEGRPPVIRTLPRLEGDADLGDVVIGAGRTMHGRVVDPDGYAVQGALVTIPDIGGTLAWSGPDGAFEARVGDGPFPLRIEHEGWVAAESEVAPGEDRVVFRLSAGSRVTLLVLDEARAPVPGVSVSLNDASLSRRRGCRTDPTGRCEFSGLAPGAYQLIARGRPDLEPNAPGLPPMSLHVGVDAQHGIRVTWPRTPTRLTVQVDDAAGEDPTVAALLFPGAPAAGEALDDAGAANLPHYVATLGVPLLNVPPGRYTVVAPGVRGTRCATSALDLQPGETRTLALSSAAGRCR